MIPKYNELYLSVLKSLSDLKVHTSREIADFVADDMKIDPKERQAEMLSSGTTVFSNRVNWANTYLKEAGLLEIAGRGRFRLTEEGNRVVTNPPKSLDDQFLSRYPTFLAFKASSAKQTDTNQPKDDTPNNIIEQLITKQAETNKSKDNTPIDHIEQAITTLNQELAEDLMAEIMAKDPEFFGSLVVKLLLKMGYGGSTSDPGIVTHQNNDGSIDGIIREDKLGFDQIYIQAKRWEPDKSIGRPEIQKFSGALRDEGGTKGLFITTARFSDGARASAEKQHIVLVDGPLLTKLMIEYNIGVSLVTTYEIKTVDSDFFIED